MVSDLKINNDNDNGNGNFKGNGIDNGNDNNYCCLCFRNSTGVSYVVLCFCGEVSWAFLRFVLP